MEKLKTFVMGGVHPPENKLAEKQSILRLDPPESVAIPLSQHLGVPAAPVVNKGDEVLAGQLIAKGEAFISANIHASVSGKVAKIDAVIDSSGYRKKAILINTEGDKWTDGIDQDESLVTDYDLDSKEITRRIQDNGVVGMGGATFPSHVKMMVPKGKKAEYLIINGVECEPCLTADHRLMLEKGEEIMVGITLQMKALGVDKAIIGIENNKADALEHLERLAEKYPAISVQGLKVKYPQGAEKQLIKALVNREVPSGKLPIEVGCVVHNVGTSFAVYEAVLKNKPLMERVVTVSGTSVKKPGNFMVRIGTPVITLIEAAGGLPEDTGKVINGGPMMGKALNDLNVPVTKGTSGILIFTEAESKRPPEQNCIRCARCLTICPMGLEPYLLAQLTDKKRLEECEDERIMDCMECGSCLYICPSGKPLLDHIRVGKTRVGKMIRERAG
ncbi:MAG: electron transport complex subunit RsxC [Bacteroidia bacterium]|nr:MAG: electron transport complex subunit RsxC [Bacteroidia bacterium]